MKFTICFVIPNNNVIWETNHKFPFFMRLYGVTIKIQRKDKIKFQNSRVIFWHIWDLDLIITRGLSLKKKCHRDITFGTFSTTTQKHNFFSSWRISWLQKSRTTPLTIMISKLHSFFTSDSLFQSYVGIFTSFKMPLTPPRTWDTHGKCILKTLYLRFYLIPD